MSLIKIFTRFVELPHNRVFKYSKITIRSRFCHTKSDINDAVYEENIKNKILKASLPFVKEHGWTTAAIEKGAETLGYPSTIHGLFPRKAANLVEYFSKDCNQILVTKMKKIVEEQKNIEPAKFIDDAIKIRLSLIIPYLNTWPQAMALRSLPENIQYSLSDFVTLVDDICYYAGDRSVDFDWYTRRIAVGTAYKATELYLIQDDSPEYVRTWTFLSKRVENLMQLHAEHKRVEKILTVSRDTFLSAFITGKNILGLNR